MEWAPTGGRAYTLAELDASIPKLSAAARRASVETSRLAASLPPATVGVQDAVGALPSFDDLDPNVFGKVRSSRSRHLLDLRSLHKLATARGGMGEGLRYRTLLVALSAIRFLYPKNRDVWLSKLWQINLAVCRPPQPAADVAAMVANDVNKAIKQAQATVTSLDQLLLDPKRGPFRLTRSVRCLGSHATSKQGWAFSRSGRPELRRAGEAGLPGRTPGSSPCSWAAWRMASGAWASCRA